MFSLMVVGAPIVLVLIASWWLRRYQRDIDAYERREFRPPLVFQWPPIA